MTPTTTDPTDPVSADLAALRTALATHQTPPAVELRLQAAFAARQRRIRSTSGGSAWLHGVGEWFAPGSAIALSLSLSAWLFFAAPPAAMVPSALDRAAPTASSDMPFIALRPLEQLALEPNPRLIETSVPKMMLAELGVTVNPDVAGDQVRAQLLVSAAGQPLALRFRPTPLISH